jgi:ribosomal protein S18 acetylase RimI-like enzyme
MESPGFSIRPAVQNDVAFLAESLIAIARSVRDRPGSPYNLRLPDQVAPREFEYALGFLQDPDKFALVAEVEGRLVACLLAETAPSSVPTLGAGRVGSIAACWVHPAHRRRGIATALVGRAESHWRERGLRFAELSYGADSETAGPAWSRQGYAPFRVFAAKDLGEPESASSSTP